MALAAPILSAQQTYTISTYQGGAPPATPAAGTSLSYGGSWIATDTSGNVYFTDQFCVFKLNTSGVVTLVAGTGRPGYSGDNGPATSAALFAPYDPGGPIAIDASGNIFVLDEVNKVIRKISSSGTITTVAGSLSPSGTVPYGLAIDSADNLYFLEQIDATSEANGISVVKKVSPAGVVTVVAGGGTTKDTTNGVLATSLALNQVDAVTADSTGNIYFSDYGVVRKVSTNGIISSVAGNGQFVYSGDGGLATQTGMSPYSLTVDSVGNLYICDVQNNRLLEVNTSGVVTTVAGNGQAPSSGVSGYAGDGGPATAAAITPVDVALGGSGNIYFADDNFRIGKISSFGTVTTVVGNGLIPGTYLDGPGVSIDSSGNLYVTQGCRIQKISPAGATSTLAGNGTCVDTGDGGLAINAGIDSVEPPVVDSSGNIYIPGPYRIREISAATGIISTIAGNGSAGFAGDGGQAINAQFHGVGEIALDGAGSLYIADSGNGRIRKISTNGAISTIAGVGGLLSGCGCPPGSTNAGNGGNGAQATNVYLDYPGSIVLDGFGNLYIADNSNWIREVSPAGIVSVIAGNGVAATSGSSGNNGPATSASVGSEISLAIDSTGQLYFTDGANFVVRSFRPGGIINTIAGNGTQGYTGDGGPALSAELEFPGGLAVSPSGSVYIADDGADAIRLLQSVGATPQTVTFGPLSQAVTGSAPFTVSATASSGLAVVFSANTLDVCTSSGNSITIAGVGTCEVTASQPGNTTYASAAVTQSFSVVPPSPQTITFGAISPQTIGTSPFALTATASSGLAVTFVSNTPAVCTVSVSTVTLVGPGLCSITATQAGDTAYLAATAVTQTFTVAGSTPQTITFNQPPSEIFGTGPYALTATASSGLIVSFVSNSPSICLVSTASVALVAGGTCSVTASQSGNATYAVAPAVTQTFVISPAAQTINFPAPPNATYGTSIPALSATASSGLLVSFASTTTSVCLVSGTAVIAQSAGTCTVTASQTGNANYSAANSVNQSFTIAPAAQVITFSAIANVPFGTTHVALSATVNSPLAITYTSNTPSVCTVSSSTATVLSLGTCSITASQGGNGAYSAAASQTQTFTIGQASNVITFTSPGAQTLGTTPSALSATASSGLTVTLTSTTAGVCTVSATTLTLVSSGMCSITATQGGNADYVAAAPVIQSFTVNPAATSGGGGGGGGGGSGSVPLTLSPTSIAINASAGTTPASQTVTLSYQTFTQGAPSFSSSFNTNQGQGWLAVSPSSGTMTQSSVSGLSYTYSATITIIGNPSGIPAGSSYTGTVNFSAAGGIVSLPVTLNVSAQPAKYSVSPQSLTFNYQQGSVNPPGSQNISVFSNPTGAGFSVNVTSAGGNWLSATAASANPSTPGTISVSVNASGLAPGAYSGQVTITAGTSVTVNVPVTLNVVAASPPVLSVSPTQESFMAMQGGATQSGQLTVSNAGGGTLSFTATAASSAWLNLSSGSGSATPSSPASLGFTINPSGLKPGVYNGTITVSNSNSAAQSTVTIVLAVAPSGGQIAISRNGVNLTAVIGGQAPQSQNVLVSNSGTGSLSWNAQASTLSGGNWLTVAPASGTSVAGQSGVPISISANPAGLAAGQYFGSVNIVAPTNSRQTVSVVLTVTSAPPASGISASTDGILLSGTAGSQTQGQGTVVLYNLAAAAVAYTSTASTSWLSVNPTSGSLNPGSNSIQIAASFGGLAAGLQTGTVGLGFSDGSSATIQVVALVLPTSGSSDRAGAIASSPLLRMRPLDTVTACAGGKASFLVPVFEQPFNGSTVQATLATTVQVQVIDDCGNPVTAAAGGAVQVTFSNGDPGINLNDIGSGVWQAAWTPAKTASQVVLQVSASENGLALNPSANVATSISVTVQAPGANAAPQPTGIANAASAGQATPQVVAPGSYIAIYGTGMAGSGNPNATAGQSLPTTLNGAQFTIGGVPLPLLYASATQVNAIVPQELAPNTSYPLVIVNGTTQSVPVPVTVTELQPGTYTVNTTGSGAGIVADALTGALITSSNPAHASQNLVIYATGLGALTNSDGQQEPADGAIAPTTTTFKTTASVAVTVGGVTVPSLFSGLTPTLTALYQINFQMPTGVASGSSIPVVVTAVDGSTGVTTQSNSVTIAVQ